MPKSEVAHNKAAKLTLFHPVMRTPPDVWTKIGVPSRGSSLHKAIEDGFSYYTFVRLTELLHMHQLELATALGISSTTLSRRRRHGRFNRTESDKLYRLVQIFSAACDFFTDDTSAAQRWLTRSAKGLDSHRPIDMIATSAQTAAALDLLGRLEFGVLV